MFDITVDVVGIHFEKGLSYIALICRTPGLQVVFTT